MELIVYHNRTRGGWSTAAIKGEDGRGKLIGHHATINLVNVRFIVNAGARKRRKAGGRREVYAYAIGTVVNNDAADAIAATTLHETPITFRDTFVTRGELRSVHQAQLVRFGYAGRVAKGGHVEVTAFGRLA